MVITPSSKEVKITGIRTLSKRQGKPFEERKIEAFMDGALKGFGWSMCDLTEVIGQLESDTGKVNKEEIIRTLKRTHDNIAVYTSTVRKAMIEWKKLRAAVG